mgnify:CR=1 FL=1
MAYKIIQAALTTDVQALYIMATDDVSDLTFVPNMVQTGNTADSRWYAKAGSCARVINKGRWYILSPSNVWKPLMFMTDELDAAFEDKLNDMKAIRTDVTELKENAASSAEAASQSEQSAADSASAALRSQNAAKKSEDSAKSHADSAAASKLAASGSADAAHASEESAASSKAAAASSEESASGSAAAAAKSQSAAAQFAGNSEARAGNAKKSEEAAKKSATSASASEKNAKASENAAAASETAAKDSETAAKGSEDVAAKLKDAAAQSAEKAKVSAENAAAHEQSAQSWAVGGTSTRDGEDEDNAKYYAQKALALMQKMPFTYSATFLVDAWEEISAENQVNELAYKQTATVSSADSDAPGIVAGSRFLSFGSVQRTDDAETDNALDAALAIINDGDTTSGEGCVTTYVRKKPMADVVVDWLMSR